MQNYKLVFRLSLVFGFLSWLSSAKAQVNYCQNAKAMAAPIYPCAENLRSDTFNILKYTINLEIGTLANKFIAGNTGIKFVPKLNGQNFIRFDLLKLIVDSIKESVPTSTLSTSLAYTYNDTVIKVNFSSPKNTPDTSYITVYYHGLPKTDASWGGFYFNNAQSANYAYNMGVGFSAKPHNFGRVWFPCFDNFVERSSYEFNITSDTLRRAHCNGLLVADQISNNKRTRKWVLTEEIPTYLACVTLANYTQVNWNINTLNGNKAITLTAFATDTTSMKNGFVNLKSCINGFENYFGPYQWSRFGYYAVPFTGGAMEHATNIAYPRFALGSLQYEDLMAHELSHHWWGNLITCETQEDMWINEGMASFSAFLFFEWQYGKQEYLKRLKTQHDDLLQFLHHREGGFRAVSGVPHNLTYGSHVYLKGADIAHTLRGYMGDSAFFAASKYTMQQNAFKSINSIEFRNLMQLGSGQNLSDFFTNWVFSGGWSHFALDSVRYQQLSPNNYQAQLSLKQKTYGAPQLHNNVPLEITFFKSDWTVAVRKVVMSGAIGNFTTTLPFLPVYAALNYESKLNDASSHDARVIKTTGSIAIPLAKLTLTVSNSGQDSSLLRVIHNYVKPDPFLQNPNNHLLSDQHYWRVEGILSPGFVSKARFNFNGTKGTSGANTYLDTLLTRVNADSIALFYRLHAGQNWQLIKDASKVKNSSKSGFLQVDTVKLGEYTFGNVGDFTVLGLPAAETKKSAVRLFPNPAKHACTVDLEEAPNKTTVLRISSVDGKLVREQTLTAKATSIDLTTLSAGTYLFTVIKNGKESFRQKMIVD